MADSFIAYLNEFVVGLCLGEVEKSCSKVEEVGTHNPSWEYKPGVVVNVSPEKKDELVHTLKVVGNPWPKSVTFLYHKSKKHKCD